MIFSKDKLVFMEGSFRMINGDNSYENMRKDDNYRRMIFAKYKDKLVFRKGSFRIINDDLYKEMYNNI